MSAVHEPPVIEDTLPPDDRDRATITAIAGLRSELRDQGRRIKRTQDAFSLFAVMALLIAMASLLAIAFKLDRTPATVVQRAAAPAATSAPTPTPLVHNVDVTLAQFSVAPTATRAAAGQLTFRVHNAGSITHELVVIRTSHLASDLPIKGGRAIETVNVGETGDLKAGATKSISFKLPAGHYALVCNLPGHYLAGQHTDFTVS